jgi:hypothetical protein
MCRGGSQCDCARGIDADDASELVHQFRRNNRHGPIGRRGEQHGPEVLGQVARRIGMGRHAGDERQILVPGELERAAKLHDRIAVLVDPQIDNETPPGTRP